MLLPLPLHAPTSPTCSSHFPYMPLLFPTPYINLPLLKLLCHAHLCPSPLHTARDCYNRSTYFNVSTGDCQPCDPTCVTCNGSLPYPDPTSGCTDCSVVLMTGATYQVRGVVVGGAVPCEGVWSWEGLDHVRVCGHGRGWTMGGAGPCEGVWSRNLIT